MVLCNLVFLVSDLSEKSGLADESMTFKPTNESGKRADLLL